MPKRSLTNCSFTLPLALLISLVASNAALAQSTAFTYQGKLSDSGNPANGQYDFQFKLYDTATVGTGTQQGATVIVPTVQVAAGIFTVQLDFGSSVFPGAARYLEIAVKPSSGSTFTTLGPREPVTSTPYAVRSATAGSADMAMNATQLGGLSSSGFIQNTTSQQAATNFNVSGDGAAGGTLSANALNAATQYNIGGARFLGVADINNTFAGVNAGAANAGNFNSFFGNSAGQANTTGSGNSFFGETSGRSNTTGNVNSFFGQGAGRTNTTGSSNSFFGWTAGGANTTGGQNSFFGEGSGASNSTGGSNSFFGSGTGARNITGSLNSFFGVNAGNNNTTGGSNSFFGFGAGGSNTDGFSNSFFGSEAGLLNTTGASNAFFGLSAGRANTTGFTNSFFGSSAGANNTTGLGNAFLGAFAGLNNTASNNSFFGAGAGQANTTGDNNSFFGTAAGGGNTTGVNNTIIGTLANVGANNLSNAMAIGARAFVSQSNSLVLGSINGVNGANADTNVGIGTTAPSARLHVGVNGGNIRLGDPGCGPGYAGIGFAASLACTNYALIGNTADTFINRPPGGTIHFREGNISQMEINPGGAVSLGFLGSASGTHLCIGASNVISSCSSSLRYKTDIKPFVSGLDIINRLNPITFTWKTDGKRDVGLGAEDVAEIEPLFTFKNSKGEIEGVKYDQLNVVLINAVKEQQAQITRQQVLIDGLKRIVCKDHPGAEVCN